MKGVLDGVGVGEICGPHVCRQVGDGGEIPTGGEQLFDRGGYLVGFEMIGHQPIFADGGTESRIHRQDAVVGHR
jgi:hypothetical protein